MKYNEVLLLQSNFLQLFLDFAKRYDDVYHFDLMSSAIKWIEERNYDNIRYFLSCTLFENTIPFTLSEFVTMDYEEIKAKQKKYSPRVELFNEEKALYKELMKYAIPGSYNS